MSSTAIVLASLDERNLLAGRGGQSTFAILLAQDLSVVPILGLFPLLATAQAVEGFRFVPEVAQAATLWQQYQPLLKLLLTLVMAGTLFTAGHYLLRPLLGLLARSRSREVFTLVALLLVLSVAGLMELLGLPPALGTFMAGVMLAESEYRHELEAEIQPFKGLLLGLFFIAIGASLNLGVIGADPLRIGLLLAGIISLKLLVVLALARLFRLPKRAGFIAAFSLAQVGEFGLVLVTYGRQTGVFTDLIANEVATLVVLSMFVSPLLFIALERLALPRMAERAPTRPHDAIRSHDAEVVIAGFGRFGQVIGRLVRVAGFEVTVLDLDPEMVDILRKLGQTVYFGDASRHELLEAAGCAKARLFVLAIDNPDKSLEVAALVRRHYPGLTIVARARNREHYSALRRLGVDRVVRETLASALEAGELSLQQLGMRAHTAHRLATKWRAHDQANVENMLGYHDQPQDAWIDEARRAIDNMEQAMVEEAAGMGALHDRGWATDAAPHGKSPAGTRQVNILRPPGHDR
jgi:Kef-type K+ transport system membrane component KefB/voltage-gated potassium channel Kch